MLVALLDLDKLSESYLKKTQWQWKTQEKTDPEKGWHLGCWLEYTSKLSNPGIPFPSSCGLPESFRWDVVILMPPPKNLQQAQQRLNVVHPCPKQIKNKKMSWTACKRWTAAVFVLCVASAPNRFQLSSSFYCSLCIMMWTQHTIRKQKLQV